MQTEYIPKICRKLKISWEVINSGIENVLQKWKSVTNIMWYFLRK